MISGTGMPSLPLIRELSEDGRPIVSSNLALAAAGLLSLNRTTVMAEESDGEKDG